MVQPTVMSSTGRVTVPREVRVRLGLRAGDRIAWSTSSSGTIVPSPMMRAATFSPDLHETAPR